MLTNALKHGALGTPLGTIEINWQMREAGGGRLLRLHWRERGLKGVAEPQSRGFGSKLLGASIDHELGGKLERNWHDDGLELNLEFPLGDK
jgi:two-component sensor histidine kinase